MINLLYNLNSIQASQPARDKTKLNDLKESLRESMVKWMQLITKSNQEAMEKYGTDATFLQKNMWYADDLIKACESRGQPAMAEWVRENDNRLPPKYFKKEHDLNSISFIVKTNTLASDALNETVKGLSIIDCRMACIISMYGALLDNLGMERFNLIFKDRLNIDYFQQMEKYNQSSQPLNFLIKLKSTQKTDSLKTKIGAENWPIKKGQLAVIDGVPDYTLKYPSGSHINYNVICCDDTSGQQKFTTLGLNPNGETEAEIRKRLLDNYNITEDPDYKTPKELLSLDNKKSWSQMSPPELERTKKEFCARFPEAKEVGGFDANSITSLKTKLIYDLKELPLEQLSRMLTS